MNDELIYSRAVLLSESMHDVLSSCCLGINVSLEFKDVSPRRKKSISVGLSQVGLGDYCLSVLFVDGSFSDDLDFKGLSKIIDINLPSDRLGSFVDMVIYFRNAVVDRLKEISEVSFAKEIRSLYMYDEE